jgi:hypothetical protein
MTRTGGRAGRVTQTQILFSASVQRWRGHAWFTSGCPHRVLKIIPAEEGLFMVICTVCGDAYWPTARWREDICDPCFQDNFRASDELRVQGEVEIGGSLTLTPRQVQAMRRIAERHQHEEDAGG